MSHEINDQFIEYQIERFEDALESGRYADCKEVIERLRDNGFDDVARTAEENLMASPIGKFAIKSPLIL